MNYGGERSQQLLAQKCFEFHLSSHPNRKGDEDFRREFFMSPFCIALYDDCGQNDQEFNVFEDTIKIPRYALLIRLPHRRSLMRSP